MYLRGFPGVSVVKNQPANAGDTGSIPGLKDPLEKDMVTHSSILAQEVPWAEEPGGTGLPGWGHKESDMTKATKQQQRFILISHSLQSFLGCDAFQNGSPAKR